MRIIKKVINNFTLPLTIGMGAISPIPFVVLNTNQNAETIKNEYNEYNIDNYIVENKNKGIDAFINEKYNTGKKYVATDLWNNEWNFDFWRKKDPEPIAIGLSNKASVEKYINKLIETNNEKVDGIENPMYYSSSFMSNNFEPTNKEQKVDILYDSKKFGLEYIQPFKEYNYESKITGWNYYVDNTIGIVYCDFEISNFENLSKESQELILNDENIQIASTQTLLSTSDIYYTFIARLKAPYVIDNSFVSNTFDSVIDGKYSTNITDPLQQNTLMGKNDFENQLNKQIIDKNNFILKDGKYQLDLSKEISIKSDEFKTLINIDFLGYRAISLNRYWQYANAEQMVLSRLYYSTLNSPDENGIGKIVNRELTWYESPNFPPEANMNVTNQFEYISGWKMDYELNSKYIIRYNPINWSYSSLLCEISIVDRNSNQKDKSNSSYTYTTTIGDYIKMYDGINNNAMFNNQMNQLNSIEKQLNDSIKKPNNVIENSNTNKTIIIVSSVVASILLISAIALTTVLIKRKNKK